MTTLSQRGGTKAKAKRKERLVGLQFNVAELVADLGDIPLKRIRMTPTPGTATIGDVTANNDSALRTATVELVDGTLVEKPVGMPESEAAMVVGGYLGEWNRKAKLGFFTGEAGVVQLFKDTARAPDVSFFRFDQFPQGQPPKGQVPWMYPDLAVEILSPSNTRRELTKKRREYFAAGTRLVWEVDLKTETVVVYREPNRGEKLTVTDTLDGENVLPGFTLSIREWMDRLTLS